MKVDRFEDDRIHYIYILNILTLLNEHPHTFKELWFTGCFKHHTPLRKALTYLRKAGFVSRKPMFIQCSPTFKYELTEKGKELLNVFKDWKPIKLKDREFDVATVTYGKVERC